MPRKKYTISGEIFIDVIIEIMLASEEIIGDRTVYRRWVSVQQIKANIGYMTTEKIRYLYDRLVSLSLIERNKGNNNRVSYSVIKYKDYNKEEDSFWYKNQ